ncbi:hypothetical protein BT93_K1721 [Corymbia citriodora subsp. variegata]|nr:hypothetical protein BT93_K1721 [Corymbia citriodora subsp. variegata]KAF8007818.1 hypothetical protein BT93_K1721 [Corymbia citriodora subsp. variegata]
MKKAYGVDRVILSLNIRFSCVFDAKPVLDFGRKALFYVGVLSGYKERSITSFRLQLEKYLRQAHERKASSRKVPEQVILTQVCHLVEKMQALNKKLEDSPEKFWLVRKRVLVTSDVRENIFHFQRCPDALASAMTRK